MERIEAVLLTGGASRRMAQDKAGLIVHGVPLGEAIAAAVSKQAAFLTVLGQNSLEGHRFLRDAEAFAGPLAALSRFEPSLPYVFVASCDLAAFDASVIEDLDHRIAGHQVAIPEMDGRLQPLCALYRSDAFAILRELVATGEQRLMRWIDILDAKVVPAAELAQPDAVRNINTPEELQALLMRRRQAP